MTAELHCLNTLDRAVAALKGNSPGLAARLLEQFRGELIEELEVFRQAAFNEGQLAWALSTQQAIARITQAEEEQDR